MIDLTQLVFNNTPGTHVDTCESEYIQNDGILVIPVMDAEEAEPVRARTHAPYTLRLSKFDYVREGSPPVIPAPGDIDDYQYLGGTTIVEAPKANSKGTLIYKTRGSYSFVGTSDLKSHGRIRFDGHGNITLVDFLGWFNMALPKATQGGGNNWNSPFFDLNILGSARILG